MLFDRTFHPDEANQAFTVGRLLETGHYTYKPTDHHGPTLYYAAAPLQKAFGHTDTLSLDGTLLRCTPLLFAVLSLVVLFLGLRKLLAGRAALGRGHVPSFPVALAVPLLAVLLVGTAPLFVFFATDFIQEMLLVCFTTMMFWSGIGYWNSLQPVPTDAPRRRIKPGTWAILFGVGTGLAFATKETSILTFAAAFLSLLPLLILSRHNSNIPQFQHSNIPPALPQPSTINHQPSTFNLKPSTFNTSPLNHLILAFLAFVLTSVILFSSFCQDWSGVSNAFIAAPLSYVHRAAGDAASEGAAWHVHPWWKHLQWLFLGNLPNATDTRFTIDTAFANLHPLVHLLCLALPLALFTSLRKQRTSGGLRSVAADGPQQEPRSVAAAAFLTAALYTALLLAFYSVIPYKTPWCTLQILVPFLVTAALGYGFLHEVLTDFAASHGCSPRRAFWILTLVCFFALPLSTLLTEHVPGLLLMNRDPDSPKIPYNYAHASPEAQQLAACVASAVNPSTAQPFIAVALPPADTWPFPWYNRPYESITGYWTKFEDLIALEKSSAKPTVVIVPMTEGHLVQPLFPHLKHTKRFFMRPGVRVRVFW